MMRYYFVFVYSTNLIKLGRIKLTCYYNKTWDIKGSFVCTKRKQKRYKNHR